MTRTLGFVEATYLPPFEQPLPSNLDVYLRRAKPWKLGWRRLRRTAYLAVHRQTALQRERIEPQHRRILFIHSGMPQVGDALMDLACRDLFKGSGHTVDLLINPHLVPLFQHDDVFARMYGDPVEAARNPYDLAILLTASSHSLREKLKHFRSLPFVHQIGFYNGPEFHRTLFGYYRLAQLLGQRPAPEQVLPRACPHMVPGDDAVKAVDALQLPPRYVVLAVGGVRGWRTYDHWPEVAAALPLPKDTAVVLVGADNGREAAAALQARQPGRPVIDRVARHPLPEVYEILRRSQAVACADGGLLHVANAARVPTVALFAERIDPLYRLTPANRSHAFHAPGEVSDVPPQAVAQALARAANGELQGVQVEAVPEPPVRRRPVNTVDDRLRKARRH